MTGMSTFRALITVVVAAVAACSAKQTPFQTPSSNRSSESVVLSSEYHAFIEGIRRNTSIPGVAVGVVRLGEDKDPQVQLASWGRKTEDGNGHDLTPDTLFCLASCSKAFLSASLGVLMDDFAHGKNTTSLPAGLALFDWDTKVSDIIPKELKWSLQDVAGDDWATRAATIRDVLGHVSGLPGNDYTYLPGDTTGDVLRRMSSLRSAYELREKWSYNNQMYMLGAHLISTYANLSYSDFVSERIFEPLRMSSSTLVPSVAHRSGKLTDTWTKDGRRIPFWFDDETARLGEGSGGVISSAEDMVKWLAVLLNKGVDPVSGKTIVPQSVYNVVTTAKWVVYGGPTGIFGGGIVGYGMGWVRWDYEGIEVVQHNGGLLGFSILTAFSPSNNVGVVILTNADEKARETASILKRTLDEILRPQSVRAADAGSPVTELRPKAPLKYSPPSLKLETYTGKYSAPGYVPISLCSSESESKYCADVLSAFSAFDSPSVLNTSLYTTYRSVWSTHARLQHFSTDIFNITFTALFPDGYGKSTSAFETYETGTSQGWVEFKVEDGEVDGFSLVIDDDTVAARAKRSGGELSETADAWFSKG